MIEVPCHFLDYDSYNWFAGQHERGWRSACFSEIAIRDTCSYGKKGKKTFRVFDHSYCFVSYNIYTAAAVFLPPPLPSFNLY